MSSAFKAYCWREYALANNFHSMNASINVITEIYAIKFKTSNSNNKLIIAYRIISWKRIKMMNKSLEATNMPVVDVKVNISAKITLVMCNVSTRSIQPQLKTKGTAFWSMHIPSMISNLIVIKYNRDWQRHQQLKAYWAWRGILFANACVGLENNTIYSRKHNVWRNSSELQQEKI